MQHSVSLYFSAFCLSADSSMESGLHDLQYLKYERINIVCL